MPGKATAVPLWNYSRQKPLQELIWRIQKIFEKSITNFLLQKIMALLLS
jgi:hypothetical protein